MSCRCDDDEHTDRLELTVIHKEAEVDVWRRLGLDPAFPDEDEEDEECDGAPGGFFDPRLEGFERRMNP